MQNCFAGPISHNPVVFLLYIPVRSHKNIQFGSMIDKYCEKAGISKIAFRGFHSLRRSFETVMVSRGVPIETVSQMMGHKSIIEDKPYITHDTHQISFVAMDFSDVPITSGFYFGHTESAGSLEGGAGA